MIMTDRPHARAQWRRPIAYATSVADPPRVPRPVLLRSSCGHVLGVGVVGKRQRFIAVRKCS
jgi:hypothetical protein